MKNSKKIISFVALLLSLVCLLSACGGDAGKIVQTKTERIYFADDGKTEESETTKGNEQPPELEELKNLLKTLPESVPFLTENGDFAYTVIYSEKASGELENAVKEFRTNINKGLKCSAVAALDSNADSGYEILVGETNRKDSISAVNKIRSNRVNCYDDFIVKVTGKKIVITGVSDAGTIKGVEWFTETFCASNKAWGFVRENYEFLYAPAYKLPSIELSGTSIANYQLVYPKDMEYVYGRAIDDLNQKLIDEFHMELKRDDERYAASDCEILIGDLNCAESKSVTPVKNEYVIRQIGRKLVIKASDSITLYYGIKAFANLIERAKETNKNLNLPNGFTERKAIDKANPAFYRLTLNDEFNSDELNLDMWSTYLNAKGTSSLGGEYLQKGTEIAYTKDGVLHIPAYVKGNDFWVSELTTKNSYWFKYGCFEVRAKMPINPSWAAIWLNSDYYGVAAEIDVLENFASHDSFAANIHKWFTNNTWDGTTIWPHTSLDGGEFADAKRFFYNTEKHKDTLTDDFHIYSVDWTEDYYRFAFDGVTFFTYDFSENPDEIDAFRQKLYFIMGCGVGNTGGPKYDKEKHAKEFDFAVDYVRLYQVPEISELVYGYKGE